MAQSLCVPGHVIESWAAYEMTLLGSQSSQLWPVIWSTCAYCLGRNCRQSIAPQQELWVKDGYIYKGRKSVSKHESKYVSLEGPCALEQHGTGQCHHHLPCVSVASLAYAHGAWPQTTHVQSSLGKAAEPTLGTPASVKAAASSPGERGRSS